MLTADVAVVGAGIAGLWMANAVLKAGYSVVLLESNSIGGIQTLASQGIIHGGTKYALKGQVTGSAQAISRMPSLWQACLQGTGPLDLRGVRVNSDRHYLWTKGRFSGAIKGLISRHVLNSDSHLVSPSGYPDVFQNQKISGSLCALNETVLDIKSLVQVLVRFLEDQPSRAQIIPVNATLALIQDRHQNQENSGLTWEAPDQSYHLSAQKIILAAGAGNEKLLTALCHPSPPKMQQRPLKMVWVRFLEPQAAVFCHVVDSGSTPALTLTAHEDKLGHRIWYLGGELAESGVTRSDTAQIQQAQGLLQTHFPWISQTHTQWGVYPVNRAEPWSATGARPEHFYAEPYGNLLVTWPTKLTLVPAMAAFILTQWRSEGIVPQTALTPVSSPKPVLGDYPWDVSTKR